MKDNNTGGNAAARSTLDMPADEFRRAGHALVDEIANFYDSLRERPLTRSATPASIRALLGADELPEKGADAGELLHDIAPLLFDHSLHNGHPRFLGYITSSGAPLGALADLLAAAVNANLGKWDLSPIASEIETQTVRWLAEFIGYEPGCSGIMVSGGNMANILGFVAGRTAKAPWDLRTDGNYGDPRRLTAYVSRETHTWVQKAADICGLGSEGVRWIDTDAEGRLRVDSLREQIAADREEGRLPFLVVATAGSVSTGVVDPVRELAALCRDEDLWLHADGAYGAPAAVLPEADDDLRSLDLADSVALDPHKWLYCPIEAACTLTRDPDALSNAFAFYPEYYLLDGAQEEGVNYYELGMQNSRGFRALKVWLALRAAGRSGYESLIRGDIELAQRLYDLADAHPELRAASHHLSITTFRYVPPGIDEADEYLNALNKALLAKIQASGDLYVSNAVIAGVYLLRACVVNFRTTKADIDAIAETVVAMGRTVHAELGGPT
jgi:glutamate/tyrosine decarboxylase-like PLP-dependent enzyme